MFEFLKKFSNSINDKKSIYDGKNIEFDGSDRSVGYVISRDVQKIIDDWMANEHIDKISFGELLYKLGFDPKKKMYFKMIPTEEKKILLSYSYEENVFGNETLELDLIKTYSSFRSFKADAYRIYLSSDNHNILYRIFSDSSLEGGVNLKKIADNFKEEIDGKTYIRCINEDGVSILIKDGNLELLKLDYLNFNVLDVNNEDKLKEYLLNIDDNTSLKDIYKRICEISLGDEDKCNKINLIIKKDGKVIGSISSKTKDNILIYSPWYEYHIFESGNKVRFTCNYDKSGKCIDVFKNGCHVKIEISSSDDKEEFNNIILILRDYLCNLDYPVKINELCNGICDKCFLDINNISYFKIECYNGNLFTDSLLIKKGKLKRFEMTIGEKTISVNEDGKFCYVSNSSCGEVEVDMSMDSDVVTKYQIELEDGIENDNMGNVMYNIISKAKDEKVRIKKMIDEMLKRDND